VAAYDTAERTAVSAVGGRYIDTTHWFCQRTCTAIVGKYEVYFDEGHLTQEYAHFLEGVLANALQFPAPTPSSVSTTPDPRTEVIVPHLDASVSGVQLVDAKASDNVGIRRVEVRVGGPGASDVIVGDARSTLYGWILHWNTADVSNGTHVLRSVLYDADGKIARSKPIDVSVRN
jgi:hypothetical protein